MRTIQFILLFSIFSFLASAQNTVGLLSYNINQTYQGYTMIYPHNQPSTFLLNNCGEIVHEWPDESNFRPGNTAYLQDDGSPARPVSPREYDHQQDHHPRQQQEEDGYAVSEEEISRRCGTGRNA